MSHFLTVVCYSGVVKWKYIAVIPRYVKVSLACIELHVCLAQGWGGSGRDEVVDCRPPPVLLHSWALTVKLVLMGHAFTLLIRKETKSSCKAQSQLAVCVRTF